MFDELLGRTYQVNAKFIYELSRCYDVYRLETLLDNQQAYLKQLKDEAWKLVKELEEL